MLEVPEGDQYEERRKDDRDPFSGHWPCHGHHCQHHGPKNIYQMKTGTILRQFLRVCACTDAQTGLCVAWLDIVWFCGLVGHQQTNESKPPFPPYYHIRPVHQQKINSSLKHLSICHLCQHLFTGLEKRLWEITWTTLYYDVLLDQSEF